MKNKYIGLLADDSPGLSIGMLAILKSGNCLVPINPVFPNDRVRFIIDDCNISILLSDKANYEKAQQIIGEISSVKHLICIDAITIMEEKGVEVNEKKEKAWNSVDSPAYVIYTSGSTGKPKGVPIAHQNLVFLFHWFRDYFALGVHTRVMQNLSYTFDFGVFEILSTILFGGRLYMVNRAIVGDFSFYAYFINCQQINTLHTTPVFFNNIAISGQRMTFIKLLHLGGERLTGAIVQNAVNIVSPGCFICNGYGPTEATINCAIFSLAGENMENAEKNNIPIGRPSAFHEIYILDNFLSPQPIGVVGELCIAGPGLSQGYLNRPELTAEMFDQDLWDYKDDQDEKKNDNYQKFFRGLRGAILQKSPPGRRRLYKTGDLARWLSDGNIEFLGRIDLQVKVRGFRIELEEIENCLLKHEDIKEAVVIAREHESSSNYLCAYIVTHGGKSLTISQLREYLSKGLPDYMIPAYFIHLESIPLTANGKIDRKALPGPDETFIDTGIEYVAPVTETEKKLVFIWKQLLRLERIGINDDFFQLGGDSILVNRCIARIREELHTEIPLRKFFERPYIKALTEEIEKQERQVTSIKPAAREGEIPLSFAQERLWFLQELDADNVAYFVPRVIRMKGNLDISIIEQTFTEIIRRHEILRTIFPTIDGQPVQRIKSPSPFKILVLDWGRLAQEEQDQKVSDFLSEEDRRPFDFEKGPLLRVTILKLKDEVHLFVLTEHHLVHDGWTQGVLLREFIAIFSAYANGKEHNLPELPIQYADFAIWQRNHLKGEVLERHLNYWKEKLAGLAPLLELPADRPRPPDISGKGELEIVRLSGSYTLRLKQFSRKNGVTLFMTMLAAFKTLLYRYTGVEDLCVGTGVANRRYSEIEGMLGMVINTLPLRTQIEGGISFKECLNLVKETCLEAYQHEDTPFGKIVEVMRPERNLSYTPLFQVLFSFMDTPGEQLRLPGLELELLPAHNRSAKFDINVVVVPPPEQEGNESVETLVEWEYNTDIFDAPTMARMVSHYGRLLEEGLSQPEMRISTLTLMSAGEMKQVLYEFNDTETIYPREKTIHRLFAEQVEKAPDCIAVIGSTVETLCAAFLQMTYRQLNEQSGQLAHLLIEKGVLADDIVGIMMERSINLIIGIMAILKAGAAYLPIDTDYPQDRIDYMLKDSGARLLVNEKFFGGPGGDFLKKPPGCRKPFPQTNHLAYIIYTSGSTGKPKGTLTTHANVIRVVRNTNYIELTEKDRILQLSNYAFDGSVFDIYGALLNRAALVLVDRETVLAVDRLAVAIRREQVTVFFVTTALFNTLVDLELTCLKNIRKILFGGERVSVEHSRKALATLGEGKIIHVYGPTETTVYATYYFIDQIAKGAVTVPIGKPIANTTLYIFDKYLNLAPVGVSGEIYIGGEGVACGYLNNPELTAEKFCLTKSFCGGIGGQNGVFSKKAPLVYRTGDLARWLNNGLQVGGATKGIIEFLGRIDQQVKIRGFRIELGEIESRLLKYGRIKEALVIDRQDRGDKYLCTYIVPCCHPAPGADELKTYLSESLPGYMIPSYFIVMEKIPLNPNGKIDRKALPEPGVGDAAKEYIPPRNAVEKKLAEIWAEVLKLQSPVGIADNFFDLGGHSLNASLLTARIHKIFNVKVPLREFFQRGCIREVAEYIKEAVKDEFTAVEPVEKKEYYPLSPAQKRMYLLHQMDEGSAAYNIPAVITLEGALDKNQLEKIFIYLIQRHENLRTSVTTIDEEPVQRIHEHVEFEIEYKNSSTDYTDYTDDKDDKIHHSSFMIHHFIRAFDLSKAPLMRVELIRTHENEHILMMDIHHIIADGTSLGILYKEMMALYQGNDLPTLKITYKDYAAWQNNQKNKEALSCQEKFWLEQFKGEIPVLNLPSDYPRPLMQSFEGSRVHFELGKEETESLKKLAQDRGATLYMVLLAACNTWFSKLSGEEDIVIGTPIAGRKHAELQDIVGMLVNTLPLRNYPVTGKSFTDFLEEVKERTLEAFQNQDYPFENLVEKLVVNRDTSRNPVFDVMFGFQNMEIPVIDVPGLTLRPYEYEIKTAKFDLNLAGRENGDQLTFSLEYSTKLFKEETIRKFAGYFKNIIHSICMNPAVGMANIEIIDHEEKKKILAISTGPTEPIDLNETIHGWFEKIVPGNEHKTALVFRDGRITYGELNRGTNRLAFLLRGKGVGPGAVVGLMVERSFEMVTGMLGIMKAGGAYLPIDPRLPGQRKQYMIEDGSISLLLTNYDMGEDVVYIPGNIELINIRNENSSRVNGENLPVINKGADLLYVLFTSGSTGKPKGVMLEHTNLVNLLKFQQKYTGIDCSKVLQFATISFDVSFQEIFTTLLAGGELYLIVEETRTNIQVLLRVIGENKIKTLFLPMSFLKLIFSQEDYIDIFPGSVEHIVTAGEQVVVGYWFRNYLKQHHIYLHNHYGPAETHVVTTLTINPVGDIPEFPPIGRPVMNTCIYVLDKGKHLQPTGIAGELYAGGLQVGRGYRGREEETREKFSENFFREGKLYRTGDLARRLADGNIEFLGRIDYQVKIRGIRVEPGEIENRLKKIVFIKDAVVVVKQQEAGDKYLCAYMVLDTQVPGDIVELKLSQLRELLVADLPDYMIPSYFVLVDKIPLTPSGKIDRRALPEPELKAGEKYTAPRDEIERKMAAIWSKILGVRQEVIGIEDNFFQLGGHSLKATLMVSRIHKEFNVKLLLADIFKRSTVRGLAEFIRSTGTSAYISIKAAPKSDYYSLSSPQRRLYILQQMDKTSTAYNLPVVLELEGMPDTAKLEEKFKKLIIRHESLRTSFHMVEEQPVQKIHESGDIQFAVYCTDISFAADSLSLISQQVCKFIQAFDLATAPLFRVGLLKLAEQKYILVVDMHHIISDGTSLGVLIQEFMALNSGKKLSPLGIQYKDYAVSQGSKEVEELLSRQAEYWLKEYRETPPVLDLPLDYPRPAVQSFAGTIVHFEVETGEFKTVKQLAQEANVTLYMVLMAVYSILLSRLSGQEEIVIGAPIAGRRHVELASIIGMFVNTLALRFFPKGNKTFKKFLEELKQKTLEAFENQEYSFEDLVEQVVVNRDTGRNPLFDAAFLLQNQEVPTLEIPGLKLKPYPYETKIAKFDLTLSAVEVKSEDGEEKLKFNLEYCTQLFNGETIQRFIDYFKNIIRGVVENKTGRIFELEIIPEEEKSRLLYDFNNTQVDYPAGKNIHWLFEKQVEKAPDSIALIGADPCGSSVLVTRPVRPVSLSYSELNEQSNRLAGQLIEKGVLADDIVAIMLERSNGLIIGIIGILKAGAAYLPIDPEYPQERNDYMLKDSSAKLLVNEKFFGGVRGAILQKSPPVHANLAYIMYTSGSTGQPKGVMVTHRNVVRLVKDTNFVPLTEETRILQSGAPVFDATTFEIWGSLLNSGQLVLVDKEIILNAHRLAGALASHRINTLWLSAPLFNQLQQENIELFAHLRYLLVGGDVLSPEHINRVRFKFPGLKIINGYGPTENTTFSTTYSIERDFEHNIPIGRPIANSTAYIYDKKDRLTPIGVTGELHVGGDGVALGYLNNPELTAEKFRPQITLITQINQIKNKSYWKSRNLFSKRFLAAGGILYKTGDLARWLANGNIEFLGRIDQQVKIRGFRVEPGEIENRLLKHDHIKEAVVVPFRREQNDRPDLPYQYLCAYFVSSKPLDTMELKEYLSRGCPDYMTPSYYIQLDHFPLTSSGKIDRKALPLPTQRPQTEASFLAPGTPQEKIIAGIWKDVLELEQVGIDDSFFELGGNSLDMVKVSARIREVCGQEIPVMVMFRYPTIRSLVHYMENGEEVAGGAFIERRQKIFNAVDRKKSRSQGKPRGKPMRKKTGAAVQ